MEDAVGSSSHVQSQDHAPKAESESRSVHEHHSHNHPSAQPKMTATTTLTAATSPMMPATTIYNVNVQFDPATPQAGRPTSLSLIITEQKVGEPIRQFDIIHDKLMHLVIVNREDLSYFAHIHPQLDKETGIFHIAHTFSKAGKYKMWIDAKPKDGMQILAAFAFNVEGQPVHTPANIVPDTTSMKKVVVADGQSYQVTLDFEPKPLIARSSVKMTFEIKDANDKPISNLEPLMAAGGHCVIIDADSHEFLHVHPVEEVGGGGGGDDDDVAHRVLTRLTSWRGGPSVSFMANFPKPGLYRAWGQFQHEGRLITADFTLEVPR
jgi:hypothetical protein